MGDNVARKLESHSRKELQPLFAIAAVYLQKRLYDRSNANTLLLGSDGNEFAPFFFFICLNMG